MIFYSFIRSATLVLLPLGLIACGQPASDIAIPKPKPVRAAQYQAGDFVRHLSLAHLALLENPDPNGAASEHIEAVEAYSADGREKPKRQTVAVFEYTLAGQEHRRELLAPMTLSEHDGKSSAALDLLYRLSTGTYTLHDIRIGQVTVVPDKTLKDADEAAIDSALASLVSQVTPVSPLQEARAHLYIARWCIERRFRDAAYLAVDNAKQSLAAATATSPEEPVIQRLVKELEVQENELRRVMPFTL